jgi:hypothetical protein
MIARFLRSRLAAVDRMAVFAYLLTGAVTVTFVIGIHQMVRGLHLLTAIFFSLTALVVVHNLAGRPTCRGRSLVAAGMAGFGLILAVTARLPGPLAALLRNLPPLTRHEPASRSLLRAAARTQAWQLITINWRTFAAEMGVWWESLWLGKPLYLETSTRLIWGLVFFFLTLWLGWQLQVARRPFRAILPVVLVTAVLMEVTGAERYSFAILLAAAVFLWGVWLHIDRERSWEEAGLGYSLELRLDVAIPTIFIAVLGFLAAAFLPNWSVRTALERLEERRTASDPAPEYSASFGVFESQPGEGGAAGTLPRSHLIGLAPELRDGLLFQVWLHEPDIGDPAPGYYWRTHTYDQYTGTGWLPGEALPQQVDSGEALQAMPSTSVVPVRMTVQSAPYDQPHMLVHTGQLVSANHPLDVMWRAAPGGQADLYSALTAASTYTITAFRPLTTQDALAADSEAVPAWLAERYLQLPPDLPDRVHRLALEIVRGHATPYEQAQAIEAYLRQFPYDLDVPLPPANQDVVDYFLFDLQRGYCDYYASAMVVLARSAGLPSRVVSGYSTGTYDPQTDAYRVVGSNAHSWVEVNFAGTGWLEFEPTAGRPMIPRELSQEQHAQVTPGLLPEPPSVVLPETIWNLSWGLGLGLVVLIPLGWLVYDRLRILRLSRVELLRLVRTQLHRTAATCGLVRPEVYTLSEITAFIAQMAHDPNLYPPVRWVGGWLENGILRQVEVLGEVSYRGRTVAGLSKPRLVGLLLFGRRAVGLARIFSRHLAAGVRG